VLNWATGIVLRLLRWSESASRTHARQSRRGSTAQTTRFAATQGVDGPSTPSCLAAATDQAHGVSLVSAHAPWKWALNRAGLRCEVLNHLVGGAVGGFGCRRRRKRQADGLEKPRDLVLARLWRWGGAGAGRGSGDRPGTSGVMS
jgi:hypothetical protein